MLYSMKTTEATAAVPRVVDAHSLLHVRASKAAKACDAADIIDGLAVLQNLTMRLVAAAYEISASSVARACRLTPEQRQAVRRGERPLILPQLAALPVPPRPVEISDIELIEIVRRAGPERAFRAIEATL
jgi:hypothetical protein